MNSLLLFATAERCSRRGRALRRQQWHSPRSRYSPTKLSNAAPVAPAPAPAAAAAPAALDVEVSEKRAGACSLHIHQAKLRREEKGGSEQDTFEELAVVERVERKKLSLSSFPPHPLSTPPLQHLLQNSSPRSPTQRLPTRSATRSPSPKPETVLPLLPPLQPLRRPSFASRLCLRASPSATLPRRRSPLTRGSALYPSSWI